MEHITVEISSCWQQDDLVAVAVTLDWLPKK
jgi:hypothetical protein